jgi:hypothetical protein
MKLNTEYFADVLWARAALRNRREDGIRAFRTSEHLLALKPHLDDEEGDCSEGKLELRVVKQDKDDHI